MPVPSAAEGARSVSSDVRAARVAGEGGVSMASMHTVEERVPVREGEYGERVVAVEPGGVEYIPLSERHGAPLDLFWTWMSPNLEFATVFVGTLGVILFGGSFAAVVAG